MDTLNSKKGKKLFKVQRKIKKNRNFQIVPVKVVKAIHLAQGRGIKINKRENFLSKLVNQL